MLKAYFYPNSKNKITTPYFDYFIEYFGKEIKFVNSKTSLGILDMIKYLFQIDLLFLNFAEDIVDRKYGKIQVLFFVIIVVPICKLRGTKIIWTLHNSESHYEHNRRIKHFMFHLLYKRSDMIITHAEDGVNQLAELNPKYAKKSFFFPHPIAPRAIESKKKEVYDFIIWGTIAPYKGIDSFLEFLHENNLQNTYKILIVGKVSSPELKENITRFTNENITLRDEFISNEDLDNYISSSKCILFPYNHESVLASGALVYSLNFLKPIIGPAQGAFKDVAKEGVINTYNDYNDIPQIDINQIDSSTIKEYISQNTWECYKDALVKEIFVRNK